MRARQGGFTYVEMAATVAIVALLATMVLPLGELSVRRNKETELRTALRQIREAIDEYRQATLEGRVMMSAGESGYPHDLRTLVDGVPDATDPRGFKLYFLRRLPRDPFYPEDDVAAEETWGLRSYASEPDDPKEGADVFDVFSKAAGVGLNGVPYAQW